MRKSKVAHYIRVLQQEGLHTKYDIVTDYVDGWRILTTDDCHDANFVVTGGIMATFGFPYTDKRFNSWQWVIVASGNDMAPTTWDVIILTNGDPGHWRIYAQLDLNSLSVRIVWSSMSIFTWSGACCIRYLVLS